MSTINNAGWRRGLRIVSAGLASNESLERTAFILDKVTFFWRLFLTAAICSDQLSCPGDWGRHWWGYQLTQWLGFQVKLIWTLALLTTLQRFATKTSDNIGFYPPWVSMKGMTCFRHAVMASYPAELTTDIPEHSFLDSGKIQSAEDFITMRCCRKFPL